MNVSRLKTWHSVNKISNRQSIHIAEEGTQI